MKKLRFFVMALLAMSFLTSLFAEELLPQNKNKTSIEPQGPAHVNVFGTSQYGAVTLDSIQGTGLVKLSGTSVLNALHLSGSVIAQNAQIGSLEVTGEANLTNTSVQLGSFIFGSLQATRSTFSQPITLLTQKAVLTGTKTQAITFRADQSFKGKQTLELKQGTIVNGPIVFEGGKGEVLVFPGCQVLGPVTGGKIIRK